MHRFISLVAASLLLPSISFAAPPAKDAGRAKNRVTVNLAEVQAANIPDADRQALLDTVVSLQQAWLNQDKKAYTSGLAADVTRLSQLSGKALSGVQAVADHLPREWEHFERPAGVIDVRLTIRQAELSILDDTATAQFWIQVTGGSRWKFDDLALMYQVFVKQDGRWKLAHQTDSWGLNYDAAQKKMGTVSDRFDSVYPVTDLKRAVAFYTPIFGTPEVVTDKRATFNLGGPRFHLDATQLDGLAPVRKGLPNGYAIFYVEDLLARMIRLKDAKAKLLTDIKTNGGDRYVVAEDPAGNVFVVMQRSFAQAESAVPEEPTVHADDKAAAEAIPVVKRLMSAWLKTDADTIAKIAGPGGAWFDDARLHNQGISRGRQNIVRGLGAAWEKYDRSKAGLAATMDIRSLRVRPLGNRAIVSYEMRLAGTGSHPFKETALVTHMIDDYRQAGPVSRTFIVAAHLTNAMAKSLDYSGYPTERLKESQKFYGAILDAGEPYTDQQYRGFWTDNSVFGIYTTRLKRDGIPLPRQANGYVSVWIYSARETYDYLKKQNATFPLIKAINDKVGIDVQPGYTQIYATDSEGNGMVFTEYPGN